MLAQDITITLDLDDMSETQYSNAIATLKLLSMEAIVPLTYDPERFNENLTKEQVAKAVEIGAITV